MTLGIKNIQRDGSLILYLVSPTTLSCLGEGTEKPAGRVHSGSGLAQLDVTGGGEEGRKVKGTCKRVIMYYELWNLSWRRKKERKRRPLRERA